MAAVSQGIDALRGQRVYIDANIFIYFLDATPSFIEPATDVLTAAQNGTFAAVTSQAVLAEVMVGPYRSGNPLIIRSVREFFHQPKLLEIVGHSDEAWDGAAMLRATLDVPFIDALHISTAASVGCTALVTNDARMKPALGVEIYPLASLG